MFKGLHWIGKLHLAVFGLPQVLTVGLELALDNILLLVSFMFKLNPIKKYKPARKIKRF